MTVRQHGRRRLCYCGSRLRYKDCHGKREKIPPFIMEENGGVSAVLHVDGMTVSQVEEEESRIPEWLYLNAARHAEQAANNGGHAATMLTVFLTAAASEALVNRLLGPLVPPADWNAMERDLGPTEKWEALGDRLGLKERFSRGRRPLQDLATVQRLRNELAHFKHERHGTTITRPLQKDVRNGRIVLDMANPGPPTEERGKGPDLDEVLAPSRATTYIDALSKTLEAALTVYREDHSHIVGRLKAAIARVREGGLSKED